MASVCVIITTIFLSVGIHPTIAEQLDCSGDCQCSSSSSHSSCTLNCDGKNQCKDSSLTCRAGADCVINCIGESACEGNTNIDATAASDVNISCIGRNACKGNTIINCGTGHCTISCESATSCADTTLYADNAASFECIGSCDAFEYIPESFEALITPQVAGKLTQIPTVSKNVEDDLETSIAAVLGTNVEEEEVIITDNLMTNISKNPMWIIVVASLVLIMVGSFIFGCSMMRKRKPQQTLTPKETNCRETNMPPVPKRAPPNKYTMSQTHSNGHKPSLPPRRKSTNEGNVMNV